MKSKTKMCSMCHKNFPATLEFFNLRSDHRDRFVSSCKKCKSDFQKKYHAKNKDRILIVAAEYKLKHAEEIRARNREYKKNHVQEIKEYNVTYYQNNIIKFKKSQHKYYEIHKDDVNKRSREYNQMHKEQVNKTSRLYNKMNKEYIKIRRKKYRIEHKKHFQEYNRRYYLDHKKEIIEYYKNKRKTDPEYRILLSLRSRLNKVLKSQGTKKSDHTMELVGCSIKYLIKHIESQFDDKMTWDNYGKNGWHIDHIRPCVTFDLIRQEEQRKCFNYKNLRPLWEPDNWKKNSFYKGKLYRKKEIKYANAID